MPTNESGHKSRLPHRRGEGYILYFLDDTAHTHAHADAPEKGPPLGCSFSPFRVQRDAFLLFFFPFLFWLLSPRRGRNGTTQAGRHAMPLSIASARPPQHGALAEREEETAAAYPPLYRRPQERRA